MQPFFEVYRLGLWFALSMNPRQKRHNQYKLVFMRYIVCEVIFCSILYAVCLELQVSKKYSSITFEHVPPTAACHRVQGQGTG